MSIQIFVNTMTGKKATINVEPSDLILDMKKQIETKLIYAPEWQRLILKTFNAVVLEDNKKVSDYNIKNNSEILLMMKINYS